MESEKEKVELTTSSQKGQVVIPREVRDRLGVKKGTKFAVFGKNNTIILKKIEMPSVEDFEKLVDFGTKFAKQKCVGKKDVLEDD